MPNILKTYTAQGYPIGPSTGNTPSFFIYFPPLLPSPLILFLFFPFVFSSFLLFSHINCAIGVGKRTIKTNGLNAAVSGAINKVFQALLFVSIPFIYFFSFLFFSILFFSVLYFSISFFPFLSFLNCFYNRIWCPKLNGWLLNWRLTRPSISTMTGRFFFFFSFLSSSFSSPCFLFLNSGGKKRKEKKSYVNLSYFSFFLFLQLLTIWIGSNNLCDVCDDDSNNNADNYEYLKKLKKIQKKFKKEKEEKEETVRKKKGKKTKKKEKERRKKKRRKYNT